MALRHKSKRKTLFSLDALTLYIDGYLHDVHEAEELMLDVFAYLFTKKPKIRDGGFKAYLYKAARHMALRHKSKRKPLFSLDALTDEPDGRLLADEVIRTEERNRVLHFCMGEMNPDYREVLYLTYFEDMSYAQAAEVTGKTVKQITNMVYRGKEIIVVGVMACGNHDAAVEVVHAGNISYERKQEPMCGRASITSAPHSEEGTGQVSEGRP